MLKFKFLTFTTFSASRYKNLHKLERPICSSESAACIVLHVCGTFLWICLGCTEFIYVPTDGGVKRENWAVAQVVERSVRGERSARHNGRLCCEKQATWSQRSMSSEWVHTVTDSHPVFMYSVLRAQEWILFVWSLINKKCIYRSLSISRMHQICWIAYLEAIHIT